MWCESIRKRFPTLLGDLAGIECPAGWETMIEQMCLDILKYEAFLVDNTNYTPVRFVQIKEKFGYLRAYHDGGTINNDIFISIIPTVIRQYEDISASVCNVCGSTNAKLYVKRSWMYPVCDDCKK